MSACTRRGAAATTPKVPPMPGDRSALLEAGVPLTRMDDLLYAVEGRCTRAVEVLGAVARAITTGEGFLDHEGKVMGDAQTLLGAALEHVGEDLQSLSDRALKARIGGAA